MIESLFCVKQRLCKHCFKNKWTSDMKSENCQEKCQVILLTYFFRNNHGTKWKSHMYNVKVHKIFPWPSTRTLPYGNIFTIVYISVGRFYVIYALVWDQLWCFKFDDLIWMSHWHHTMVDGVGWRKSFYFHFILKNSE